MNGRVLFPLLASLVIGLAFLSCQNVFTASLAKPFARDPSSLVPKVTAGNAAKVADQVKADPDASLEVLTDLSTLVLNATGTKKTELAVLALDVSASASGVGGSLMQTLSQKENTDLLKDGNFDDPETKTKLYAAIDNALAGMNNLGDSASALEDILTTPGVSVDTIKETASAEQMAMAAIVLLSNNASSGGGVSTYVDTLGSTADADLSASEKLAKDLAAAAAAKYEAEGGSGPLADVLKSLNLTGA